MNTSIFWEIQFTPQGVRKGACDKDASHEEALLNELSPEVLGLLENFPLECAAPIIRRGCRKSCLIDTDALNFIMLE